MSSPLDPDALRWNGPIPSHARDGVSRPPRHDRGQRFLKGPIPLGWLSAAGRQPGKALHVANVLWFIAGLTRTKEVKLATASLAEFGVNRHAGYRGLAALEQAGLVAVRRHRGRQPIVTLLEVRRT